MTEQSKWFERWQMTDDNAGFTPVANAFLMTYADMNITPDEAIFVIHYLSYKWTTGNDASIQQIADLMGKHRSNTQAHVDSLIKKGYITRLIRKGRPSKLDLSKLFDSMRIQYDRRQYDRKRYDQYDRKHYTSTSENGMGVIPNSLPYKEERIEEANIIPAASEVETTAEAVGVVAEFKEYYHKEIAAQGVCAPYKSFKTIYEKLGKDDALLRMHWEKAKIGCAKNCDNPGIGAIVGYLLKSTLDDIRAYEKQQAEAKEKNPYGYVTGMPCMCGRTRDGRTVTIPTERLEEAKADGVIIFTSEKAVNG